MGIDWGEIEPRHLPVYLLLDTSASMQGTKIVGVNNGVTTIYEDVMSDPRAASTVHICLISFADEAYQMPMVPVANFVPPVFNAAGKTAFGDALRKLDESLEKDIRPNRPAENGQRAQKGDFKPIVYLLTDGMPTDDWRKEAARLNLRRKTKGVMKPSVIVGLAIGDDADPGPIREVADVTLVLREVTLGKLGEFFTWVSHSVIKSSEILARPDGRGQVAFDSPPGGFMVNFQD